MPRCAGQQSRPIQAPFHGSRPPEILAATSAEAVAALEQAPLVERCLARAAGGLRELGDGLRQQRVGASTHPAGRAPGVEPDVFVGGCERAAFFEQRERLARTPERDQRLGLAEQPVHVVRIVGKEHVEVR